MLSGPLDMLMAIKSVGSWEPTLLAPMIGREAYDST